MAETTKIDRRTTTPFLLRLFYRSGNFHRLEDFSPDAPLPPHVQIYTWQSCSLKELTHLLASALPSLFPSPFIGTRLCFRLIYADTSSQARQGPGRYSLTELGTVVIGTDPNGEAADDELDVKKIMEYLEGDLDKTLQDARFVIGDYISCAILPPLANGDVAPPPARGPPPRSHAPPRQNGFGSEFGNYGGRRGSGRFEGPGRFEGGDRRAASGVPPGEWRRGDVPPPGQGREFVPRGRGRGRGW